MILICIFLMTYDVEHLFMFLFAIQISPLVKYLFKSFAHFNNWVAGFRIVEFMTLYIVNTRFCCCWACDLQIISSSLQLSGKGKFLMKHKVSIYYVRDHAFCLTRDHNGFL